MVEGPWSLHRYLYVAQAKVDPLGCISGWLGFLAGVRCIYEDSPDYTADR